MKCQTLGSTRANMMKVKKDMVELGKKRKPQEKMTENKEYAIENWNR